MFINFLKHQECIKYIIYYSKLFELYYSRYAIVCVECININYHFTIVRLALANTK